jgi:hypothetical protein
MGNPKLYTYEELKIMSKKRIPSDVDRDRLEVCKLVFLFIKYQNLIFLF